MGLTKPTPLVVFSLESPSSYSFDPTDVGYWYRWGYAQAGNEFILLNEPDVRWVGNQQEPKQIYFGPQYPFWSVAYEYASPFPFYQVFGYDGYENSLHKFRYNTLATNICPEYTIHYLNKSRANIQAWMLFYAKCNSLYGTITYGNTLYMNQNFYGRIPWVYNNQYAGDGVTEVVGTTSRILNANPFFLGEGCGSPVLDGRTEITYNGNTWDNTCYRLDFHIERGCTFNHQSAATFMESIWPSHIIESRTPPGMFVDLYIRQGEDNTIMEDIYDSGGKGEFKVKLYHELYASSSYYLQLGMESGTAQYFGKVAANIPNYKGQLMAYQRFRFHIPYPQIVSKDLFLAAYSTLGGE